MHQSHVKLFLLLLHKGHASSDELIVGFSSFPSCKYSVIVTLPSFLLFRWVRWVLVLAINCWPITCSCSVLIKPHLRSADARTKGTRVGRREEDAEDAMFQRIREWLSLKNYQYQVTTGIYMLEPWERTIFSILFGMDCCNIHLYLLST